MRTPLRHDAQRMDARMVAQTVLARLREIGADVGGSKSKRNPHIDSYLVGVRNRLCIFDVQKTAAALDVAAAQIERVTDEGGSVLFVGTKKSSADAVATEAARCGMPYVSDRWMAGFLTNFRMTGKRMARLAEIDRDAQDPTRPRMFANDASRQRHEHAKLVRMFAGTGPLRSDAEGRAWRRPDLVVVVDAHFHASVVRECAALDIPTIGLVGSTGNPWAIDTAVPMNVDRAEVVRTALGILADAALAGRVTHEARAKAAADAAAV
jgi:small subunit ribosomal protein S2